MERVVRVKRGRHETPSEQLLIHTDVAPPSKHARLAASLNQLASGLDSLSVRHNQGCLRPPDATDGADAAAVEDAVPPTTSAAAAVVVRRVFRRVHTVAAAALADPAVAAAVVRQLQHSGAAAVATAAAAAAAASSSSSSAAAVGAAVPPPASYQQVRLKRTRDADGGDGGAAEQRRRAKRDPLRKAFRVFDVEHVPAATAAAAAAVKEQPVNPLAGYEELLCNHMPMLRELVASLPAEQAAGAQRQLEAQADELKRAVQADSNAKAAEADFVYDYYMCEAGEAAELEAEAHSRDAAATSAEQENVSWQQRLAHLPVLHLEESDDEMWGEDTEAESDSDDSQGEQDYPDTEEDDASMTDDEEFSFGRHRAADGGRRELSSGDELDPYGDDGEYYSHEAYDPAADFL